MIGISIDIAMKSLSSDLTIARMLLNLHHNHSAFIVDLKHTSTWKGYEQIYVMLCAIWYHLHNLKKVKNTHGGELLSVLNVTFLHGCFTCFLNCTNGTKSRLLLIQTQQ